MRILKAGWVLPVLIGAYLILTVSCVPRRYKVKPKGLPKDQFWGILRGWGVSPTFYAEGDYEVPWGPLGKIQGRFQMDARKDSLIFIIGTSWDTLRIAFQRDVPSNEASFLALRILNKLLLCDEEDIQIESLEEVEDQYLVEAKYDTIEFRLKLDKDGRPNQINISGEQLEFRDYKKRFPTRLTYRWQRGRIILYVKDFEERR